MDDLNHLFQLQGVAHYTHARARTSAARLAGRLALAETVQRLDAARRHSPFAHGSLAA